VTRIVALFDPIVVAEIDDNTGREAVVILWVGVVKS
jgi:hypothetical protein